MNTQLKKKRKGRKRSAKPLVVVTGTSMGKGGIIPIRFNDMDGLRCEQSWRFLFDMDGNLYAESTEEPFFIDKNNEPLFGRLEVEEEEEEETFEEEYSI
jgi:hypothetical protein